ncbi:1-aminocyclopropane-1-carboxylate synthase-like protein 1 isoform 3-T3 [Anableps anableps]
MDFRARRYERGSNWTDPEIVELLQLWSDESVQIELESSLRNQRVFDRIAHILREKGIYRSGDQCREKIKKMKLEYRRIKDNHKMRTWKFYDVMDRVLANRPAVSYSSLGGAVVAQQVFQGSGGSEAYLHGVPAGSFGPSCSGFRDMNAVSATSATHIGPVMQETSEQPRGEAPCGSISVKQRKRRRGGRASCGRSGGRESLDRALVSFLNWQQSAEERLLSLEEARLEREFQAEERREQREERRAEKERQHELHLFTMLTGALFSTRQEAAATMPSDRLVSPLAHLSTPPMATAGPAVSSSLSQFPQEALTAQPVPTQETKKSQPMSVKTCQVSQDVFATLRGAEAPGHSVYLSSRGNSIRQHQGILQEGFIQYAMDKHHQTDNPDGIVNLGTSENKLCYDLLHKRVVVMNGCGSLFSCIAAVICDPKDAILIPTPFYGVITEDVHLYSDVKLFHVPLDCEADGKESRHFHLTVGKLEAGLKKAKQEGWNIRALILMNPHNPLAEIYTPKEMIGFLEFAKRNELHAIIDEVYMLTVFDESVTFHSVLSIESLPDPQRTHVMWGMSKDFAMAGIRIGTLYTVNTDLVEALAQLGSFHGLPGTLQHQVAQLLRDRDWINNEFLPENRRRLKSAHSLLTRELQSLGIPFLDRPATLYVWADLRKYLSKSTFEEELSLWRCFLRHKVLLSCGQAFSCSTPGWFRIVFADQQPQLQLGLQRIQEALKEIEEENTSSDTCSIKGIDYEGKKPEKEENDEPDNTAVVNSTSSPQSKSSDQLKERDSPVPDTGMLGAEEFVLLDCQKSKPAENLDSLIGTLRHQIRSSDWLEKNTPVLSHGEDPEILDVFKSLLQRAKK